MKRMMLVPDTLPATEQAGRVELFNTDRNVLKQVNSLDFIEYLIKKADLPADQKVRLIETALQSLIVGKEQGRGGTIDSTTGKPSIINRVNSVGDDMFSARDLPMSPTSSKKSRSKRSTAYSSVGHDSEELALLNKGAEALGSMGFETNDNHELVYDGKPIAGSNANHMLKFFADRLTNDQAPVGLDETLAAMKASVRQQPNESGIVYAKRKTDIAASAGRLKKRAKRLKQSGSGLKPFLIPQSIADFSRTPNASVPKITRTTLPTKPRSLQKNLISQWQLIRKN